MSLELRILSGLHRGAILPLSEGDTLTLGAHEDADVVLVDPGMAPHHAKLVWEDSGCSLLADEGVIYAADSPQSQTTVTISQGTLVRVGPVWVGVFLDSDPWSDPPAQMPQVASASPDSALHERSAPAAQSMQNASAPGQAPHPGKAAAKRDPAARRKRLRLIAIPAVLIGVATAAIAVAFAMRPASINAKDARSSVKPAVVLAAQPTPVIAKPASTNISPPPPPASTEMPDILQTAFKAKLREAELLDRFDLDLQPDTWSMQADLDDEEAARFERLLKTFIAQHKISFPVNAKIVTAEGMLPFRIRQVTYGAYASIVTTDGERLYVGDELKGIRLLAVDAHKLTFAGKRKIEVNW